MDDGIIIPSVGVFFMFRSSLKTILPAIPIWISVFSFATVHESTQLILSLILSLLSIYLLRLHSKTPPKILLYSLFCCCIITFCTIIPLPISLYSSLLGTQSALSKVGLMETNATWQPLAFRPRTHAVWILFSFSVILYGWACASIFSHVRRFKIIAHQIIYCAIVLSLLAWLQKISHAQTIYWISDIPTYTREYFFGSFVNPNHAGAFLASVLPLTLSLRGNKKYIFALIIALSLWSTQSRGAVLAGIIGVSCSVLFMYTKSTRYLMIGILFSLFLASIQLDFFQDPDDTFSLSRIDDWSSERLDIWRDSLSVMMNTPFWGTGSGGFVDLYDQFKTNPRFTQTHHSHQEFIELITTYGWMVGSILIALWFYIGIHGFLSIRSLSDVRKKRWMVAAFCAFLSYTAAAMIDFPLQIGANLIVFTCYAAVLLSLSSPENSKSSPLLWGMKSMLICTTALLLIPSEPFGNTKKLLQTGESIQNSNHLLRASFFRHAIRSAPFASRPLRQYALSIRQDNLDKAIAFAQHATTLAPSNSLTWISLAELHNLKQDYVSSLSTWKRAITLDLPDNDDAVHFLKKAIALPLDISTKINVLSFSRIDRMQDLARILYENNLFPEAQTILNSLSESDPKAQIVQAELYLKTKNPHKAWSILSKFPPQNCQIARIMAKTLLQINNSKEAIRYFRIAIDHCGATEGLTRQLLLARLIQGEERAIMEASLLLRSKDKNIRIRRLLLHALALKKDYNAMLPHLEKLKEQNVLTETEQDDIKRIQYGIPILSYPLDIQ